MVGDYRSWWNYHLLREYALHRHQSTWLRAYSGAWLPIPLITTTLLIPQKPIPHQPSRISLRISSWECGAPCFCPLPVSSPYEQSKYTFCLLSRGPPPHSTSESNHLPASYYYYLLGRRSFHCFIVLSSSNSEHREKNWSEDLPNLSSTKSRASWLSCYSFIFLPITDMPSLIRLLVLCWSWIKPQLS